MTRYSHASRSMRLPAFSWSSITIPSTIPVAQDRIVDADVLRLSATPGLRLSRLPRQKPMRLSAARNSISSTATTSDSPAMAALLCLLDRSPQRRRRRDLGRVMPVSTLVTAIPNSGKFADVCAGFFSDESLKSSTADQICFPFRTSFPLLPILPRRAQSYTR